MFNPATILLNVITSTFTALRPELSSVSHTASLTNILNGSLSPFIVTTSPISLPNSIERDIPVIEEYLVNLFKENPYTRQERVDILHSFSLHYKVTILPKSNNFYTISVSLFTNYLEDGTIEQLTLSNHGSTSVTVYVPEHADEDEVTGIGRMVADGILKQVKYF